MALINCKECGQQVSSKADVCPNCGTPLKRKPLGCGAGCGLLILVLIVFGVIGSLIPDYKDKKSSIESPRSKAKTQTPKKPVEVVANSDWDASVYQVERFLKKNLKDPKSFEAIEWSRVTKVDLPSHKYVVRCKYRAKNSFGGYVIHNQLFYLDVSGKVVKYMDYGL